MSTSQAPTSYSIKPLRIDGLVNKKTKRHLPLYFFSFLSSSNNLRSDSVSLRLLSRTLPSG